MKIKYLYLAITIIGVLTFLLGIFYAAQADNSDPVEKIVKCYDQKGNVIIGQSCVSKNNAIDEEVMAFLVLGFFLIVIGNIFYGSEKAMEAKNE